MAHLYRICLLLICCCLTQPAFAGAWVQEKGKGLDIFTVTHYASTQYWTPGGELKGSPLYTKYQIGNYLEYGLTERLTLGLSLSGLQSHTGSTGIQRGDFDNMLLGRYQLWKSDRSVFSAQLFADYLGHARQFNVPPQTSQVNTGEALLVGTSGLLSAKSTNSWFADASLGLIQRYANGSQLQVILEGGLKFKQDRLWLFLQSFNTLSLNRMPHPQGINYNLATLSPSIIVWVTKSIGGQIGAAQDVFGQNVGRGTSTFFSLWLRF